jgi:hypothetical protein
VVGSDYESSCLTQQLPHRIAGDKTRVWLAVNGWLNESWLKGWLNGWLYEIGTNGALI